MSFKEIFTYLVLIVIVVNTYLMYGLNNVNLLEEVFVNNVVNLALIAIGLVVLTGLFLGISHMSKKRAVKKNFLRLTLLMSLVFFIVSLYARFTETLGSSGMLWRWSNTFLYLILFVMIFSTCHDLYLMLYRMHIKKRKRMLQVSRTSS